MSPHSNRNSSPNKKPPRLKGNRARKNYLRYSGLGFTFLAIIFLGLFGGMKLDDYFDQPFPVLTLVFSFVGFIAGMYYLYKQATKQ